MVTDLGKIEKTCLLGFMGQGQSYKTSIMMNNLACMRSNRLIYQNISQKIVGGEILWVKGRNGSGKSTLIRQMSNLLPTLSGSLEISGDIALTDEKLVLDSNLPLEKALRYWADMDHSSLTKLDDAMQMFDLILLSNIPVQYLSTGQRKRANLARVFASEAKIYLLDEPYNGLDQDNIAALDRAMEKHVKQSGLIVIASHIKPQITIDHILDIDQRPAKSTMQQSDLVGIGR